MAEASSSSRPEPKTLVEDSSEDELTKQPSSTNSRRHSHYDTQRTGRPVSGSSQLSAKSKGKRASYQQHPDFPSLDEVAGQGQPEESDDPYSLEQARRVQISPKAGLETKILARRSQLAEKRLSQTEATPPAKEELDPPASSSANAQQKPLLKDPEEGDADDESSDAPSPYVSRRPEDYLHAKDRDPPPAVPRWLTEMYTISYLILFSIFGTLARLGLQWLTFYPGAPIVTPLVWANMLGCIVMGFLIEDQTLFQKHVLGDASTYEKPGHMTELDAVHKAEGLKRKKTIPLYIGLTVGFCGSLTSFSSFARDFFLALSNDLPTPIDHPADLASTSPTTTSTVPRHRGYSFEAWAAVVLFTIALALGGLMVGAHLAHFLGPITPRLSIRMTRRFLNPFMLVLGWGSWLGAVFLAIWPPDRPSGPSSRGSWANETWRGQVLFALVFAPVGCLLRFYASVKLNPLVSSFPLGTFAVNMLGTAVEGMCYDIQHVGVGIMGRIGGGRVGCQVLQGVQDGFCGCLTTVSTWAAEIHGLRRRHGYAYAVASILGALCLMVIIMGSIFELQILCGQIMLDSYALDLWLVAVATLYGEIPESVYDLLLASTDKYQTAAYMRITVNILRSLVQFLGVLVKLMTLQHSRAGFVQEEFAFFLLFEFAFCQRVSNEAACIYVIPYRPRLQAS
ncbi:hypothetical protein LTR10_007056 [Elasticomyces elasticus]|nr:hypothetical protein LTR10_007056 [Elasticomyces elasticus]KAK4978874.1 hypothetical protein LTR42_001374 [Elasticomyces elasticus]